LTRRRSSRRWTALPTAAVRAAPAPASAPGARLRADAGPARVLGLDPGSLQTGYAVLDCVAGQTRYLASGTIRARGADFPARLRLIYEGVLGLAREYQPTEVAIERVFMHRNADSALKLGQARGAALCAAFSAAARVYEYAPREVKLAVVGTGGAQKAQVQLMVRTLLGLRGEIGADAADAIGIALCHAHLRAALRAGSVGR
jgi:crossover junction endodeoxyribonuclease RuvC